MLYMLRLLGFLNFIMFVFSEGWGRETSRPNVLVIMADDLGFSDLGCYGGEIETPHLDGLAANGLRFTQFYNTARCWPTRAALLTGYYAQQVRRDALPGVKRGNRPYWARLLPEMLKSAGYRSYHSGKWHLDGMPLATGFDRSYYINNHGFFRLKFHYLDDKRQPPTPVSPDFYVTDAMADHAVAQLKEHAEKHPDAPFLHYLAFTAPHFPLHAKPEDIVRYRKTYRRGWDVIREARWKKQRKLGMAVGGLSKVERKLGPPYHFPDAYRILGEGEERFPVPWDKLTAKQKAFQADKMAVHAAMVYSMDKAIGRVLEQLRTMNAFENTLVLFLSDNGSSAEIMVRGDGHDPKAPLGSAFTYLCLGAGWSTACNTPFRKHKTWTHEGGIRTPLVVHWPKGIEARGELRGAVGHVIDIVPTLLELAGVQPVETSKGKSVPVAPGKSLVRAFSNDEAGERDALWWSHDGHRALRLNDWKLVAFKGAPWELFDLAADPAETRNLAANHPEKVAALEKRWLAMQEEFRLTAKEKSR